MRPITEKLIEFIENHKAHNPKPGTHLIVGQKEWKALTEAEAHLGLSDNKTEFDGYIVLVVNEDSFLGIGEIPKRI